MTRREVATAALAEHGGRSTGPVPDEREAIARLLSDARPYHYCYRSTILPGPEVRHDWMTGSFEEVTGYPPEEWHRLPFDRLVHPEDLPAAQRRIERLLEDPGFSEHDFRIVRRDGVVRHIHEKLLVEPRPEGLVFLGAAFACDGTAAAGNGAAAAGNGATEADERAVAAGVAGIAPEAGIEAQASPAAEQAEQLARFELLAGGLAHNLNNTLAIALGYAELLLRTPMLSPDLRESIRTIQSASEQAARVGSRLLEFTGRTPLESRPLDLPDLVREAVADARRASGLGDRIVLVTELGLPEVPGDRDKLLVVLRSLLENAAEALKGVEEPTIEVRVGAGRVARDGASEVLEPVEALADHLTVEIRDNGPGMEPEVRRRAFEPFFTTRDLGRGLGLPAVYGILRAHGGGCRVLTGIGEGTVVTVSLPLRRAG